MERHTPNSSTPLLSVGLPVWNGLPYLRLALESLCSQEMADLEIIVSDNASTDGTEALVRDFASRDARIRYVRNERNIGASRNYNQVFRLARGRYFRWGASDDVVSPGALPACVRALEESPSAIVAYPETILIDESGAVLGPYDDGTGWEAPSAVDRFAFSMNRWGLGNLVFGVIRTEVLRATALLGDYPGSDLVLQSDLAARGPFRRVGGAYYYRRIHARNTDGLSPQELAQFYEPDRVEAFGARQLVMYRELARVVTNAPVQTRERLRMWVTLARYGYWSRYKLAAEARELVRQRLAAVAMRPSAAGTSPAVRAG